MSKNDRIIETIEHYQRNIGRACPDNEELLDPKKVIYCLDKLSKLPINTDLLHQTGIGKTVNCLIKFEGVVSEKAKIVVTLWKAIVKAEEQQKFSETKEGYSNGVSDQEEEEIEVNGKDHKDTDSSSNNSSSEEEDEESKPNRRHKEEKVSEEEGEDDEEEEDEEEKQRRLKYEEEKKAYEEYLKTKKKKEINGISKDKKEKSDKDRKHKDENQRKEINGKESKHSKHKTDHSESRSKTERHYKDHSKENERNHKDYSKENERNHKDHTKENERNHKDHSKENERNHKDHSKENERNHKDHTKENEKRNHKESRDKSDKHGDKTKDKYKEKSNKYDEVKVKKEKGEEDVVKEKKEKHKENEKDRSKSHHSSSRDDKKRKHSSNSKSDSKRTKYEEVNGVSVKKEPLTDDDDSTSDVGQNNDSPSERSSRESSVSSTRTIKKENDKKSSHKTKESSSHKEVKKIKLVEASDGGFGDALLSIPTSYKSKKKSTSTTPTKKSSEQSSNSKHKNSSSKSSSGSHHSQDSFNDFSRESSSRSRDVSRENSPLHLLSNKVKLEPLEKLDIASTLPEISPDNYFKPHLFQADKPITEAVNTHDELCSIMTSKNQRTKVFSGTRSVYTKLPSLFDMCIRILQENIDALEYTGGVPYDILKPVLERASAEQLYQLEHYNPYLMEDTATHWQYHCNKDFRGKQREEYETWRDLYLRCLLDREKKLKEIRQNINQSKQKSIPVRQTKLAYVDAIVKPPRNVARQQARFGTGKSSSPSSSSSSSAPSKADIVAKATVGGFSNLSREDTPVPVSSIKPNHSGVSASTNNPLLKKKKAPLMAKALQSFKGIRKR